MEGCKGVKMNEMRNTVAVNDMICTGMVGDCDREVEKLEGMQRTDAQERKHYISGLESLQ